MTKNSMLTSPAAKRVVVVIFAYDTFLNRDDPATRDRSVANNYCVWPHVWRISQPSAIGHLSKIMAIGALG